MMPAEEASTLIGAFWLCGLWLFWLTAHHLDNGAHSAAHRSVLRPDRIAGRCLARLRFFCIILRRAR